MRTKVLKISLLACLVAALSGCATPNPPQEGRLYVRTLIDGRDTLYIKGDLMWFVHHAYQYPGHWAGSSLPTYINQEQVWDVVWNGTVSDMVKIEDPKAAIPTYGNWDKDSMSVKHYTASYGTVVVKEYPNEENNHTLVIDLIDIEPTGAHWFCIDIDWDDDAQQEGGK